MLKLSKSSSDISDVYWKSVAFLSQIQHQHWQTNDIVVSKASYTICYSFDDNSIQCHTDSIYPTCDVCISAVTSYCHGLFT